MMKKISISSFSAVLSGELLLFAILILLTGKTDYIWIAVAAVFAMLVSTTYCFCSKLKSVLLTRAEMLRDQKNENSEKIYQICNSIIDVVRVNNEGLSKQLISLANMQEKVINDNSVLFQRLEKSVDEICKENASGIDEIKESIIKLNELLKSNAEESNCVFNTAISDIKSSINTGVEGLNKIISTGNMDFSNKLAILSDKQDSYILTIKEENKNQMDNLISGLGSGIDSINNNYAHIMEEMSLRHATQIEQWSTSMETIVADTQNSINTMICNVDEHLTRKSEESSRVISDGIKNSQESIEGVVNDAREMMQEQYKMLNELNGSVISDIHGLLEEKLNLLIEQEHATGDMLNTNTDKYCQQLSKNVIGLTNDNINKMISSCENILNRSLEQIIDVNENMNEKYSEDFGCYMDELKKVYNETIENHIRVLEEQIKNSISEFTAENKTALDKNNELSVELISTEKNFISELEENNTKLRETIQSAFEEYSRSVEGNITEFKNVVTDHISENADNTKLCIDGFAGKNEETMESFAEKLKNYSDSFVDRSAQAIANVQADNNNKLQELCDRVSEYAKESSNFIVHCKEANDAISDNINDMIQDREELINNIKVLSDEHIEGLDVTLKSNVDGMNKMLQKLNAENSNNFSETMLNYRDKFVEANAEALAAVQRDNMNSIAEANKKIVELAEKMKTFRKDISTVLIKLEGDINGGLETQTQNNNSFHENMDELFNEKLEEYNGRLQKYNEIFEELSTRIKEVIEVCENNTSKYDETLKFILNSQKEANSLNNKDIELLKSFMKR